MNVLQAGHRFTADYPDGSGQPTFRCFVEVVITGWGAYIFDFRTRGADNKPVRIWEEEFISGPEEGRALIEEHLSNILRQEGLPLQPLIWRETRPASSQL